MEEHSVLEKRIILKTLHRNNDFVNGRGKGGRLMREEQKVARCHGEEIV